MQIDFGRRRFEAAFESRVLMPNTFPIIGYGADRRCIKPRVAPGMRKSLDDGAETGLGGPPRESIHRGIDRIGPGFGSGQHARSRNATGVMCVEVDGKAHLFLQDADEKPRSRRLQQACHVLQPQHMGTGSLQLLGHANIVFEIILGAVGVENIARIADRGFAHAVGLDNRLHGDAHVVDPVEAVKHAEHVNTAGGRLFDEGLHHIIGIGRVAHTIGAPQQHLQHEVRHGGTEITQALPWAFLQESVCDIKCRPAPAFDAEQLREVGGIGRRNTDHVDRAHAGCQQRLVTITHRRIGEKQPLLGQHPVRNSLWAFCQQQITRTGLRRALELRHGQCAASDAGLRPARRFRMAVHRDIGDIGQDLGCPVTALLELEEFRRCVDELGGAAVLEEARVLQQVLDKGNVGSHAAHAKF